MTGGTQLLARGGCFALFRAPLGHVAIVGQMRDGLDIEISVAHVDFVPVKSPCVVVDCLGADMEALDIALTVLDWVLTRASLEPVSEVWIIPESLVDRRANQKLIERTTKRRIIVTHNESQAVMAIMRVREDPLDSDVGIRWSALLHATRSEAARPAPNKKSPLAGLDALLLRTAIGEIRESIMVTDADLTPPGPRILYVNRAFTEITGYTSEEVVGRNPAILHGARTDDKVVKRLQKQLEGHFDRPVESETINYRKDGTEFSMQWSVHPLRDDSGKIVRLFAIQRDTTDQRRYEAIARAVNMTDNIGMIFSGIRHELGNPVNSIKTALSVLRKQHRAFGPDKTDSYLDRIMAEVSRVEFLLSSLRSFTAFEHAKTEEIDISAFLKDFSRLVRSDFEAHSIKFDIVEEVELPKVRVDPRALNQVLLNLVHNASDALAEVKSKQVRLVAGMSGPHVRLVVRDNGCGMSPEHISRLFIPFHTTKERGTGLGLVIAQKLVTEMGGHLHVKSERRRGTDVTIEFARNAGAR